MEVSLSEPCDVIRVLLHMYVYDQTSTDIDIDDTFHSQNFCFDRLMKRI